MEEEYKVKIALEIIQIKVAKLLNSDQSSYDNFKEELESLREKERKIYNMDEKTIIEVCEEYKNEVKMGDV